MPTRVSRKRLVSRTLAAAGTLCAVVVATAVPAAAAQPAGSTSDQQDVTQLTKDISDLVAAVPELQNEFHPLFDSPALRDSPLRQAGATSQPIPGCTVGALQTYANQLNDQLSPLDQEVVGDLGVLGEFYSLVRASDQQPQSFGSDGQYTPRAEAVMDKLRSFWDIKSFQIELTAWKGTDLGSEEKMGEVFGLGFAPAKAKEAAALANKVLFERPAMEGGRNPLLSLNAISSTANDLAPEHIALGDGVLDVADALGYDNISVETVLSHEFGHQVDFANNDTRPGPISEMGADAKGGYFLAHAKGEQYDPRQQQEVTYLDGAIGDCMDDHGTPQQRMAAGAWGENVATSQADPNRVIPSATFKAKWEKEFPKLHPATPADQQAAVRS